MSGIWVHDCEKILEILKKSSAEMKGKDRLDVVRIIRFTLGALQRSVAGWMQWINNPDVMATFSLEELQEINKTLLELTQPFVEYDAKITGHSQEKLTKSEDSLESELVKKARERTEVFYVK